MSKFTILFVSLIIANSLSQGIVDFQYTEYTQVVNENHHHQTNLDFQPIQINSENLQFPEACSLIDKLQEPLKEKQNHLIEADIDLYLNEMKEKFLQLLTLTQKITNSETKILHFEALINKTNPVAPNKEKISQLEEFEKTLSNFTQFIRKNQQELKEHFANITVYTSKKNQQDSKRIQLDFNIDFMRQKINYLKEHENKIRFALSKATSDTDYNNYFSELENQFNNQSILIESIDSIIRKKDDLTKLRKQKANLQSSIMALDLYIKDVELCHKQKENIRQEFKNHDKINQLIIELKQMKMTEQPNIYCEGVVKKLTEKIKTMLRYYDIVASCASDLSQKMNSLKKEKEELIEINRRLTQLEAVQNLQNFQLNYNAQKVKIDKMYFKIKQWKIKQFTHDPEQIARLKIEAQNELQSLLSQKDLLPSDSLEPQKISISKTILNLINSLKQSKAQYCLLYHQYDELANLVWTQAYAYESQMNLKQKLLKLEYEQKIKHKNLNNELLQLRAIIYQKLR